MCLILGTLGTYIKCAYFLGTNFTHRLRRWRWWRRRGLVVWWLGGLVTWWLGGWVGWWLGGMVAWWVGGLVAW